MKQMPLKGAVPLSPVSFRLDITDTKGLKILGASRD